MPKVTLSVQDMKCDGCVNAVRAALEGIDGVESADVSLDEMQAHVEMRVGVEVDDLVDAVRSAGYRAAPVM